MAKVLMLASIAPMIEAFNKGNLSILQQLGNEVHVAANFYDPDAELNEKNENFKQWLEKRQVKVFDLPIQRSPFASENLEAYRQLKEIFKEENYTAVHAHSPIGGVLARLAGRDARKEGMKVLYTAHGFHFFKGAPLKNWLLYYPVEKLLSYWTDLLITINPEDYKRAKEKKFGAAEIAYVNGVGINLTKFSPIDMIAKKRLRSWYGVDRNAFVLIYVGELSDRKNQMGAVRMMASLVKRVPTAYLLLVGEGDKREELEQLIKEKQLEKNIRLMGFRTDIPELMSLSDVAISCSRQEGLPVNVMEAMATGLPVVASDCRGNRDLVENDQNGFVYPQDQLEEAVNRLERLAYSPELRERFGRTNRKVIEPFAEEQVKKDMEQLYRKYTRKSSDRQSKEPIFEEVKNER